MLPRVHRPDLGGRQRGLHPPRFVCSRCIRLGQAEEEGHLWHRDAPEVAVGRLLRDPLGLCGRLLLLCEHNPLLLLFFSPVVVVVVVDALLVVVVALLVHIAPLHHLLDGPHRLLDDPPELVGLHALPPALALLLGPQKVARAAPLHVVLREAPTRAQPQDLVERSEPARRLVSERREGRVQQVRAGFCVPTADSST